MYAAIPLQVVPTSYMWLEKNKGTSEIGELPLVKVDVLCARNEQASQRKDSPFARTCFMFPRFFLT
ncbi:hypothetical protein SDC9_193028 [bioreactor metagenome]|uniref:Uncharacterized protein n=1 Tax=bioreactor metagenome TaxID=1076179 RepID=A0A645I2D6_9ZZZZ